MVYEVLFKLITSLTWKLLWLASMATETGPTEARALASASSSPVGTST